ncbi:immunoglobulin gamma-1 heavy chain-like [Boleophthalmus pectinirostris]|uniref:immunoglobulin gamma-1 heavy chain-like n=1 Tax=Boleophthalmus pectinirostris TaxID=150288 RepID=UPI00242D2B22|nr:immunoglobulin gamma-1 heavy chain-like [Boleophthalmus pectinirostris]
MIGPLTAFVFLSTLCQSAEDQIPVTVVQPGDSATFRCASVFYNIYWYKQSPGRMMEVIKNEFLKPVDESFEDQRFKFTKEDHQSVFTIQNIRKEDEAIYYCIINVYGEISVNGTFLVVNDGADSQSCVHVTQSPSSASVVPGHSVSLQCSLQPKSNKSPIQCPQQQQVHWFRAGSVEPQTGLVSQTTNSSCVYSLSKTIGHSSEAGTYYCAVHTCGHILFGTGTTLDIDEPLVLQLQLVIVALSGLLGVCVLVIIVLCVTRGRLCAHCRDSPDSVTSTQHEMSDNVGPSADVNYAALNFSSRKMKQSYDMCVSSYVRAEQQ